MMREADFHMIAMNVQAWPEDTLEIQPKRSCFSESQTPSHWEERSTSATATADDEPDHPNTELQVRMLVTKDLLRIQCHARTSLAMHATSGTLQAITSVYT